MRTNLNKTNLTLRKNLSSGGLRAVLMVLLIAFGVGNAWANSSTTYYSKVSVSANPTGAGTVYVKAGNTFSGTKTSDTQDVDDNKSHTYSIKATPATGYAFKSWSGSGVTINGTTNPSTTCTITASSTDKNNRTSGTATATFVKVFQFKAKADLATGSAGLGDVCVNFDNGTPAYQASAVTATATQNGDDANTASKTKTAYFSAQSHTGTEFRGWYSDAACNTKVSGNASYSTSVSSSVIAEPSTPQLTLYAKFEKVETTPSWALSGIAGTEKTLEIGEMIGLVTETAGNSYSWGTPSYVDANETNPVMTYDASTKTFTANRAGTVTVTFSQAAGEDANGVLWKAGSQTFTFTVNKCTPQFAWADPLPNFVVGTTLPVSDLFSFTPAESTQNWTLTSSDPTNLPSIAAPATGLSLPKEVNGVTLTFHQDATWKWNEIANTSIKINVTKEPVTFNWKNPALIAGNTYSWTDFVETNSEGAWNLVSEDENVIPTMRSISNTSGTVAAGTVTLTFTQGQDLAHDAVPVQTKTFTVYPADGLATFKVGNSTYTTLTEANNVAKSGNNKVIIVARDGVLPPGDYTISSGVTLLVPYSSSNTSNLTTPPGVTTAATLQPYRTLTLVDGANITVSGNVCVGGQIMSGGGGNSSSYTTGDYGLIDMSKGGYMSFESGAKMYCWGYVRGQGYLDGNNTKGVGTIEAKSGSEIWEDLFVGDFRGGTAMSTLISNKSSWHFFPFQSYSMQNVEVPVTYHYGSSGKVYANVYVRGQQTTSGTVIGSSSSLFLLNNNQSTVRKWYDATTDLVNYELNGTATLASLTVSVYLTVNSADYYLPINSSMQINVNCDMTLNSPIMMQPGSVVNVKPGRTLTLNSKLFVFDHDDWGLYSFGKYFRSVPTPTPHKNRGDGSTNTLEDAKIIVDGKFVVASSGSLYTTDGYANIMSHGGGVLQYQGNIPSATTIKVCTGAADSENKNVSAAKLHNDTETENDTYTASISSTTFDNLYGRWFTHSAATTLNADHTYNFTYINGSNTGATAYSVYASDKTGLTAGYKWVNVALDNTFCGSTTYSGDDGHYYYYNSASKDAVSKWVQLVKLNDALYSGSDNNLYTFTNNCLWASVGEIDENCMYTIENKKMALVGTQFVELEKDEYDEVYVNAVDHSDYYMAFDGCVWQHATKIPDTYRAYEVLGNPYIWLNDTWTQVAEEGAYYYITDDQNVKHYYEFDNVTFSWQPVKPKVRITTSTDRDDFLTWDDAMAYLGQYTNPTVTLLDDAIATRQVTTLAPGSKSTEFTFDFNGHTLTANIGANAYFMNMNTTATLYITDSSDKQNGQMLIYSAGNKKIEGIIVTKGKIVMNGGRIYLENAAVYASNTSCQAWAISLRAGQSMEMNGGEVEAKGHRNAVGLYLASSAATATTSKITIDGGKVTGIAPNYAYGIISYGIVNMNGGTVEGKTEAVTSAGGTTAAGTYAYGIYGYASVNAVDANSYYSTINMTGGTVNAKSYSTYAYGIYAYSNYATANGKKSDNTSDNTYKPTDGTYSNKASCKLNITGGTINAIVERSSNSYGIYSAGTFNSYKDNKTITPHVIKNVKIFSQATSTAYGILMSAQVSAAHGGMLWGEAIIDNADVYAETTVSTNAYAVYATATNIWSNRVRYSKLSATDKQTWYVSADNNDGDITHEAIAATSKQVYQYHIGWHVAGAKITINSGTYRAKSANSTSAYGVYCNRSVCPGDPTGNTAGMAEVTINGGTFSAETMTDTGYGISNGGITTVNGGTINVRTGTTAAYGVYGWGGTLTLNSGVVINSTADVNTAYGVVANGWVSTDLGLHTHGEVIVNDGVTVNVTSPNSSTAYGAFAKATNAELNQTKYNARSESNRNEYYAVNEEGTTTTNALKSNYYPYRFGTYIEGGVITINGGTFNVNAFTTTAIGAVADMSSVVRANMIGRVDVARGVINIHDGVFNVKAETSTTAEGIRSYGIVNVDGGTFNIQSKTTTAYGLYVMDGTTTVEGGTFNIYAGTNTAVGLRSHIYENNSYGYYVGGEAIINGGTFNVNTWNGNTAYGVYVTGATGNFSASSATSYTGEKPAKYAVAGRATINGGTFIMNPSTGVEAYGFVLQDNKVSGTAIAYPKCEVNGGFFQMKGTGVYAANATTTQDADGNPNLWVKGGHFSTKTNLEQASPKNYVRDPYHVIYCVHPDYKDTYPYEVAEAYTITFKDDAGNTLWSGLQPKGSVAVYPLTNGVPEKAATATNSFEFASWNTPLAEVTEDATYTASFTPVAKKFMVTWRYDANNEIDHMEYASGATPAHADPVKEGYTFTGWTPSIAAVVDADQTYTANFTINQYTIRWEDEDGTLIREDKVNYNVTPTKPSNPTKEGYSFSAWNPGIVKATEDVTYTATYLLNIASVTTSAGVTTNYTAWSSALSAANGAANSTLTLLTDVGGLGSQTVSQTFTLDLNGHTLSGTANKLINVNKAGKTLTIRDSQGGGKIATKSATSQLIAVCVTAGTLNIESGLIRAENTYTGSHASYYGCGVWVVSGYACNMSGGTVEGITNIDYAYGIYNNGGTVNITGGTINAEAQNRAYGVVVNGNTTVESDAAVNASTTRTTIADAFYVIGAKTLTISGGVFTANALTTAGYAIEATAAATINVDGGKFKSSAKTVSNTGSATIHLNAGFYDKDTELAGFASPKKVAALTNEPEKAEGYNYKIVDDAHQITFKNEDGSIVLQQSNIEDGVQPVYHGEAQTKASTPKYSYTFDGWKDASDNHVYAEAELPVVSKDVVYTAHFAQNGVEYPITFANIDGMGTDHVQMVAYGEVPVYDGATPYMSGAVSNYAYTFIGWDPELVEVTGAATYTPRYDLVISHNVSFVINNGSATTPVQLTVAEGAAVERPADQLIDCQHIAGWYKDAGLNEEWDFANDKLGTSDLTLYAKWETKTYTITWLDESANEIDQTTVNCGTVPTHADLYKASTAAYSYEWKGWNKTIVAANGNATYKSLGFTQVPKRYAITFVTGSGATTINPIELEVGSTVTAPADPTRPGYTFNGWVPAVPSTMPANDVECVAQWTPNQYTITFNSNGGSDVSPITQNYGTSVTAPANPTREGYTFAGWNPAVPSTMPVDGATCVAQWTPKQYTITFNSNGGSDVSSITQDYGTSVSAPANPTKVGYTFDHWDPAVPGTMPLSGLTCNAQWTPNENTEYKVRHYKQNLDDDYYTFDKEVTETGTTDEYTMSSPLPDEGFVAIPWEENTIAADGSTVVEIYYNRKTYTVTWWDAQETLADHVIAEQTYKYGATPSYTYNKPSDGAYYYVVTGWTPGIEEVTEDITYTAVYKAIPLNLVVADQQTINSPMSLNSATVRVSGHLSIAPEGSLTTTDLVIEASKGASGEITGNIEDVTATNVYFDYAVESDGRHWNVFGVPFEIGDLDAVKLQYKNARESSWTSMTLGRDYDITYYDEATRAAQGPVHDCWKYVEDQPAGQRTLQPGIAYSIAFLHHIDTLRFTKASGSPIEYVSDVEMTNTNTGDGSNGGWNGIANPKTYHALLATGVTLVQIHDGAEIGQDGYDALPIADYKFVVGNAGYVQVTQPHSVLEVATAGNQEPIHAHIAARRTTADEASELYTVEFNAEGTQTDRVYVRTEEGKSDEYTVGSDVMKMSTSSVRPQIWVDRYNMKLCMNTVAPIDGQAAYPLGLYAPAAGEYTIALQPTEDDTNTIYLTCDGLVIWNLTYSPYLVQLEKGTNTRYGLQIVHAEAPAVTTGIVDAQAGTQPTAQKVLLNDKVYILRGTNVYTVEGQMVK